MIDGLIKILNEGVEMNKNKYLFLTVQQMLFLAYFLLTTIIFLLSMKSGNDGVTLSIFGGGDDGFFYWKQIQNIYEGKPWIRTSIYPLIIGSIMKLTGISSVYLIRILNYFVFIFLIMFSMYLIKFQFRCDKYKIESQYMYNSRVLLLLFFLFYVSIQMNVNLSIYRDVWIYMIYTLCVYLSIKIIFLKKNRLFRIFPMLLFLWLLGEFRKYALLSFLFATGIYFVYRKIKIIRNSKRFILLSLFMLGLYYTFLIDFTIMDMSLKEALNYRASSLNAYSGGSQMNINLDQPNYFMFLINYMHSYTGNLLGPLPWHVSGISTLFVFLVETIPMLLILRFLWKKRRLITNVQKYILIHGFVWVSLIGFTNDNLGTATRLRPVAWILIFIVFVVVYSKNKYFLSIKGEKIKYEDSSCNK